MALSTLAVVSQSGESLSFYDVASGERTGKLEDLLPEPHELCYDGDTNLLYISHAYKHGWYAAHGDNCAEISVLDCTTRRIIDVIDISPYGGPHYLVLDKPHGLLYASVEVGLAEAGGIIAIDLATRKIVKAIPSGHKSHWFVMTPNGKKAYTCNKEMPYISVLDLEAATLISKIPIPGGTEQPDISNDGRYAYFPTPTITQSMKGNADESQFGIAVIDTTIDQIIRTIRLDLGAVTIHVDPQDRLLVGQYRFSAPSDASHPSKPQNGQLTVLAPPSEVTRGDFVKLAALETGLVPLTVFASPDGSRAFASNIFSGTVTVVDLRRMEVERTLVVDVVKKEGKGMLAGAHGLACIP